MKGSPRLGARSATLIACLLGGCAEVHGGRLDAGTSDAADASVAAARDAGAATVALTAEVRAYKPVDVSGELPLEDVTVCARPRAAGVDDVPLTPCTTSDAQGYFTLSGLPPEEDLFLTLEKDGFVPMLWALRTRARSTDLTGSPVLHLRMSTEELQREALVELNVAREADGEPPLAPPATTGSVVFGGRVATTYNVAGVTATLDPPSGEGPFFVDLATNHYDPSLTRSAEGTWGAFFEVTPGEVEIVFEREGALCRYASVAYAGWPADSGRDNAAATRIEAGYVTWWTLMECRASFLDGGAGDDGGVE